MKILVIGSGGFIGSHCVNHFLGQGHEVTGCDTFESTEPNYISLSSIEHNFNTLLSNRPFDYCINAAGSAHVNYSFQFPEKDFELNVFLVINLLGAIKNHAPHCKFINFSSAAVYGNATKLPITEDFPTLPLSPYGYHKLLSENLLYEYYKFFKLQTCSLRVFSAYGERLRKQLFWDLYNKSTDALDIIKLYGTGLESRDFIYIKDLISIVDLIMKKATFTGEIYNVGNGEEIYIKDAVEQFLSVMGWKGTIVFSGEYKVGDPINWKADISKIRELGYTTKYTFEEGIRNYCVWLKGLK